MFNIDKLFYRHFCINMLMNIRNQFFCEVYRDTWGSMYKYVFCEVYRDTWGSMYKYVDEYQKPVFVKCTGTLEHLCFV